jgi:hypothetical protein
MRSQNFICFSTLKHRRTVSSFCALSALSSRLLLRR